MNAGPTVAWLDGHILPAGQARLPLDDRGLEFGESLYEVVPVTAGRARMVREHARRMRAGAETVGIEPGVPDEDAWTDISVRLCATERLDEGILYAQVTGGSHLRMHVAPVAPRPTFFAHLLPLRFPRQDEVSRGTHAISLPDVRWGRSDLKTTMLLPAVMAKREAARRGAGEALLVGPEGDVREGASSNLFIVERGRLITPPQSHHILPGITRLMVRRLAGDAGIAVADEPISLARLRAADEVLVTSSVVLVMPVVMVDEQPIGSGVPGPVATDLARQLRLQLEIDRPL